MSDADRHGGSGSAHLGRRAFLAATAGTAVGLTLGATPAAGAVPAGATYFVPLTPQRLCDTRPPVSDEQRNFGYLRLDQNTVRVQIAGRPGIPADAVAAVFNLAGIARSAQRSWVQAVPAGTASSISNLNLDVGDPVVANLSTVKLNWGSIDIRSRVPLDVILDIAGVYVPTSTSRSAGRLELRESVSRIFDTRPLAEGGLGSNGGREMADGQVLTIDLTGIVPNHATAIVANVAVVGTSGRGRLTAFPSDEASVPHASNLNYGPNQNRAVALMTKIGRVGGRPGIKIFVLRRTHVLLDVVGHVTGEGVTPAIDGLFVPMDPNRMLDTRRRADRAAAGQRARLWPGWSRSFDPSRPVMGGPAVPSGAGAIAMNLTAADSFRRGFLTVLPSRTVRRVVSHLNMSYTGQNVANHVITRMSDRGVEVYSNHGCEVICDVNGWYVGSRTAVTTGAPPEPPPPGAGFPWRLVVPDMGLDHAVEPDLVNADRVVDRGLSWHWTNTGLVGEPSNVVTFGHRTTRSAPYYRQHVLGPSSRLYVHTADRRIFTFRYAREEITGSAGSSILAACRRLPGPTFTLVSCTGDHRADDQPRGGIRYRLVTTFVLESWVDSTPPID